MQASLFEEPEEDMMVEIASADAWSSPIWRRVASRCVRRRSSVRNGHVLVHKATHEDVLVAARRAGRVGRDERRDAGA